MSARPPAWRTALLLTLMVILLAAVGWYGLKALIAPVNPQSSACVAQTVSGTLTSDQVTIKVLNGGSKRGLAASIQTKLKAVGFNVPTAGNNPDPVLTTTIVGTTAESPEVLLVAGFFPEAVIQADGRSGHTVDVLVGDTFGTFDDTAPTQIDIDTAVVCMPTGTPSPSQTPTDTPIETPTDETTPPESTP